MKKYIIILFMLSQALLQTCFSCDNKCIISNIQQMIDSAETIRLDEEIIGEWDVLEFQKIYRMDAENDTFIIGDLKNVISIDNYNDSHLLMRFDDYTFYLKKTSTNVIDVPYQEIKNVYGVNDIVHGKVSIIDGVLYAIINVVGLADFGCIFYFMSQCSDNCPQWFNTDTQAADFVYSTPLYYKTEVCGSIYIFHNGKRYNLLGAEIK